VETKSSTNRSPREAEGPAHAGKANTNTKEPRHSSEQETIQGNLRPHRAESGVGLAVNHPRSGSFTAFQTEKRTTARATIQPDIPTSVS
jgi:hypothetical protein